MSVDASSDVRRLHGSMLPGVGCAPLAAGPDDGADDGAVEALEGGTIALEGGGTTASGTEGGTVPEAPPVVQAAKRTVRLRIAA
jgi:hypothetical protein